MTIIIDGTNGISDVDGSAATPAIRGTDANTGIFFPAADTIAFTEGGTESMRIDSSGQLLVGTTTALAQTTIYKNGSGFQVSSPQLTLQNAVVDGGSGDGPGINFANATGAVANIGSAGNGVMFFSNRASTGAGWSERMRIDSSGNVGIGISSPTAVIDVLGSFFNGGSSRTNTNTKTFGFRVPHCFTATNPMNVIGGLSTTSVNYVYIGGSDSNIGGTAATNLFFYTAANNTTADGTLRMSIDSSGNVGIGTSSPTVRFQVSGSSIFSDTVQIFNNPTSSAQGVLFRNTFNTGGSIFSMGAATTNDIILWVGGSGTQGAITGNGAGINYSSASDYRLKENVAPMTGALAKVSQLKPCTYIWKFDGSEGQGFIAHELQEVFPDAVTGKKDDVETYTDEDGNEQTRIKPQGVDTSFLVATLTAAIQELKAELDSVKAELQTLKGS